MSLYSDTGDFFSSSDEPIKPKPKAKTPPPGGAPPPVWAWGPTTTNQGNWGNFFALGLCDNGGFLIPQLYLGNWGCLVSYKFEYTITSNGVGTPGGLPFWCWATSGNGVTCGTAGPNGTHQYLGTAGNDQYYRIETTGPCAYSQGACQGWHDPWFWGVYADTYTITPTHCECDGVVSACPPPRTKTILGPSAISCCDQGVFGGPGTPTGILHEWVYSYHLDWIYDFSDPEHTLDPSLSLITPLMFPPIGFGTPSPNPSPCTVYGAQPQYTPSPGIPFTPAGTPMTVQDFHSLASCTQLMHMGVSPGAPMQTAPTIGYQFHLQNLTANLDYPNQVSFCEWRTDWDTKMTNWYTGGQIGTQPTFTSPVPLNNNPGGLMAHELWGMTTTQAEDITLAFCCPDVLSNNPGSFAHYGTVLYPPADLTVSPPINSSQVIAEWVYP